MYINKFFSYSSIALFFTLIFAAIANAEQVNNIGLQNLTTRELVYCYSNPKTSAEDCAKHYESKGFVRLRDIPSKTAKYDSLTVDTYPTRRWRNGEITPRW